MLSCIGCLGETEEALLFYRDGVVDYHAQFFQRWCGLLHKGKKERARVLVAFHEVECKRQVAEPPAPWKQQPDVVGEVAAEGQFDGTQARGDAQGAEQLYGAGIMDALLDEVDVHHVYLSAQHLKR